MSINKEFIFAESCSCPWSSYNKWCETFLLTLIFVILSSASKKKGSVFRMILTSARSPEASRTFLNIQEETITLRQPLWRQKPQLLICQLHSPTSLLLHFHPSHRSPYRRRSKLQSGPRSQLTVSKIFARKKKESSVEWTSNTAGNQNRGRQHDPGDLLLSTVLRSTPQH